MRLRRFGPKKLLKYKQFLRENTKLYLKIIKEREGERKRERKREREREGKRERENRWETFINESD